MKTPQRRLSQLTLLCLSLLAVGCSGGKNQQTASDGTTTTEPKSVQSISSELPTFGESPAKKQSPGSVPNSEPLPPGKSHEQPARVGSGQTFLGTLRARLPMDRQSSHIDWSPDGKWLLVDGSELWSTETGKSVRKFGDAKCAIFHPNGMQMIGCVGKAVLIWDLELETVVKQITTQFEADEISCSANGNRLLLIDRHSNFGVCDVEQARSRTLDRKSLGIDCHSGAISPDAKTLALSGEGGKLVLVDAETLTVKVTWDGHRGDLERITYSHDGKLLATCCTQETNRSGKVIRIWNAATGERLNEYTCSDINARRLQFSRGGTRLLSVGSHLYVDDPFGQGTAKSMLDRGGWVVDDAVLSPDAQHVAAVTNRDQDIHLFDLTQTRQEKTIKFPENFWTERLISLRGADRLLALRDGHPPAMFDPASAEKPIEFGSEIDRTPAISPDGKLLVAANRGKLYWYHLTDGKEFRTTDGSFVASAFHPDGKNVLAGNRRYDPEHDKLSHDVQEIETSTGELKRVFGAHNSDVTGIDASSDGRWLASGGEDARVLLFDYQSGKLQHQTRAHEGAVSLVRFSPSGEWLVSLGGERDWNISLWKMGEPSPRYLASPGARIIGAVFAPNSKLLVTGNADGQFRVWDLAGNFISYSILSGCESLNSMEPLPDGSGFLAVCRKDQCAKSWKFQELQRPLTFDNLVRTDTTSPEDRKLAVYNGLLAHYSTSERFSERLAVSADESLAATLGFGGQVTIWGLPEIRAAADDGESAGTALRRPWWDHRRPLNGNLALRRFPGPEGGNGNGLAFSRDGKRLLTLIDVKDVTHITIWDLTTGMTIKTFQGAGEHGRVASSAATNIVAVTRGFEPGVRLIDLQQNVELPGIPFNDRITALCIDPAGKHLVIGSDRRISIIDLATKRVLQEQKIPGEPRGMAVSMDGKRLVVSDRGLVDTQLRVFNFNSLQQIVETPKLDDAGVDADFTRDGRYIVLRAGRRSLFYDAQTGVLKRTLALSSVDGYFAQDGKTLVTTDRDDECIDIVNLPDLFDEELQTTVAEFGPGLRQMSRDGKYHVWAIDVDGRLSGELLGKLKQVKLPLKLDLYQSRNLTDEDLALLEGNRNIYGVQLPLRITAAGLKSLATCENLEELAIPAPSVEVLLELSNFPKLRVLGLGSTEAAPEQFEVLKHLQRLEVVQLNLNDKQTKVAMKAVVQLPQLRALHWEANITEQSLAELAKLPRLQGLTLRYGDDLDAKATALSHLDNIKELAISNTDFTDAGLQCLKSMKNLEGLDLSGSGVKEGDILVEFTKLKWVVTPHEKDKLLEKLRREMPQVRVSGP